MSIFVYLQRNQEITVKIFQTNWLLHNFLQIIAVVKVKSKHFQLFSLFFFSYHTVQLSTTHIFMYSQIHFLYQIICIFGTHFIPLFALMRTMVRLADVENIAYGYNVRGEKPRKRRMKKKLRAKLNSIPKKKSNINKQIKIKELKLTRTSILRITRLLCLSSCVCQFLINQYVC